MNKLNYLIFDDHPLVCVAIKSLLEELGKTNGVFTATSAKMALQILKKEEIQLL
ncbi:DNA-binding response regulator, partial [Vibrio parahaemolyticus]|nr:DNA-binding response regulator [Vibrio parahaemolyticus]